ncbi:hypothetical protein K469DRAFT_561746 [Zopfia rhizophila CBS 207.26]|uniref:N-acetyltransferase domain-containing protein n=1 Tax=Zopfia rhizophila CBS 207.26 TaxID=1314779 RepID=A0A6A6EI92_9PEZI|nr:hypothetical protein K469DRAFT_561746 [Zopfia rhizophila CBS 207.26]
MSPKAPPFCDNVRLATIADVPRIAVVATAGFYYSPVFSWERTYHKEYPRDTMMSYQKMFADIIRDPQYVALVIEDEYRHLENNETDATIEADISLMPPKAGTKIIVGAATWKFQPRSSRVGQFMDSKDMESLEKPTFDGGLGRDKSEDHTEDLDCKCDEAEEKYFQGHQLMDMIVVHPAYWRRGNGTKLVKWGLELADLDRVKQGVIAAEMGEKLYLSMNYKKLYDIEVMDDENSGNKVKVGVLQYTPSNLSPHGTPTKPRLWGWLPWLFWRAV